MLEIGEIQKIILEKVTTWYETLISMMPNFVVALLIITLFAFIAKGIRRILRGVLNKTLKNRVLSDLFSSFGYLVVLIIGLFISLEVLKLDKTVTSLLAGAGVIGLALGFAFQEIISNFVSGIFIAFKKPYRLGDIIKIDDTYGEVTEINLRTTTITDFNGIETLIPNKFMFTKPLSNYTSSPLRRIDMEVGVSYDSNLELVEKVAKEALSKIENRYDNREVEVYFYEFGGSSINFSARVWIHYPGDNYFLTVRHQMVLNIKKAFEENDINIPFPIRTLDINEKVLDKYFNNS